MKTVRTISGVKKIDDGDKSVTLLQIRDLFNEQRKLLINRLLNDLHVYIDYRFQVKADARQLDVIKEKLDTLKNHSVDMEKYRTLLQRIMENKTAYINTEPFYQEI